MKPELKLIFRLSNQGQLDEGKQVTVEWLSVNTASATSLSAKAAQSCFLGPEGEAHPYSRSFSSTGPWRVGP